MTTISKGNTYELYVPVDSSYTFTPGSGGSIRFGCSSPVGSSRPIDRNIYAAETISIPGGSTFFAEAIGADATETGAPVSGGAISVGANVTITSANAGTYSGATLEFTGAYTVTLSVGLPTDFGFAAIPPSSGNASIASDGTALLNGATTTLTRAAAGNAMFAVVQRDSSANSYVVTGS